MSSKKKSKAPDTAQTAELRALRAEINQIRAELQQQNQQNQAKANEEADKALVRSKFAALDTKLQASDERLSQFSTATASSDKDADLARDVATAQLGTVTGTPREEPQDAERGTARSDDLRIQQPRDERGRFISEPIDLNTPAGRETVKQKDMASWAQLRTHFGMR